MKGGVSCGMWYDMIKKGEGRVGYLGGTWIELY